jgi:hypothetical protein
VCRQREAQPDPLSWFFRWQIRCDCGRVSGEFGFCFVSPIRFRPTYRTSLDPKVHTPTGVMSILTMISSGRSGCEPDLILLTGDSPSDPLKLFTLAVLTFVVPESRRPRGIVPLPLRSKSDIWVRVVVVAKWRLLCLCWASTAPGRSTLDTWDGGCSEW